jgi:hypothetical protein
MTATATAPAPPTKRRRGRPAKVRHDLTLAQLATVLRIREAYLERLLEEQPKMLPGAERGPDGWTVPQMAVLKLLVDKTPLEMALAPRASITELAAVLRLSLSTVYSWTQLRNPETGAPLLPTHRILGHVRVYLADVAQLPETWPSWAPSRPAFFV